MHKTLENIYCWCYPLLRKWGIGDTVASYASLVVNIAILSFLTYIIYMIFRFFLVTVMAVAAKKTKTRFDDLLISNKTAKYISHLIPLLFIYKSVPVILNDFVYWESVFGKLVGVYIILLILWIVRTIFNALRDYLKLMPKYSDKPIDSYIQVIMLVLWMIGVTVIISELFKIRLISCTRFSKSS